MMDPEILRYYELADEGARLDVGVFRLEHVRTVELLDRFLPAPPARVLDVGGATGAYSEELGLRGYETHLIDAVEKHVEAAKGRRGVASARVGDARALDWPDSSADVVLLMGPLYHLTEAEDRRRALAEAGRVLRQGGLLFAAGISRFASVLDGLMRGYIEDARFRAIVEADLEAGQHRNPTDELEYFTTAYFHRPEELAAEIRQSGFVNVEVLGVEGPCWLAPDFEEKWSDPGRREVMIEMARKVESEKSLMGASAHLAAVGWKV